MNKRQNRLLVFSLLVAQALLFSCERNVSVADSVDSFLFSVYGGTVFEKPPKVGLKEIHLDDGRLQGKRLVVEGHIESIGDHFSYVVISDRSARMLILLSQILDADESLKAKPGSKLNLRVLGTVYKGKKGLPYIAAESLKVSITSQKKPT
ncbi:hypothetical protein N9D31_03285 [Oligoflexaceae bacterium]|nr:hypothetical protein [Oligoflexaceae bacterium]